MKSKLLVITGPTASGKTEMSLALAKKYSGEIVSADSRQVYRGMDIGTAKIPLDKNDEYKGVKHHLIDVASPKRTFSVAKWKNKTKKVIKQIHSRGNLPIIVGGTGFYIEALIYDLNLPEVKPNPKLRKKLEKLSLSELLGKLKKIDPDRAKTIDQQNKRRLIRAIEIVDELGHVPKIKKNPQYDALILAIKRPDKEMRKRINTWVESIKNKIIPEIKKLRQNGVSWQRLENFGLVYWHFSRYLQGKMSKQEAVEKLKTDDWHYAKRQITYLKRLPVKWIKNKTEAERAIRAFLS